MGEVLHLLPTEAGARAPLVSSPAPSGAVSLSAGLADVALRHLLDPLLAALFPSSCSACGQLVSRPRRGPLCDDCWRSLPRHRGTMCLCGRPISQGQTCAHCRRGLTPFATGFSLGPYSGGLRVAVHELKYRGRRHVAARLVEQMWAAGAAERIDVPNAVVVPVPLHPRRRRERGFNQAELLARALASRCDLPVVADALVRRKDTPPQTALSAAQRRGNVQGAFAVRRRAAIAGRTIILVDDVFTTGATAMACARLLRRSGAAEVRLITAARVT